MAEMFRLGAAFGAEARTYAGMAGMGDLVATCTSRHSRNRRAGELLAQGVPAGWIESEIGQVAEGLTTAPVLEAVAAGRGLELPITCGGAAASPSPGRDPAGRPGRPDEQRANRGVRVCVEAAV